MTQSQFDKIGSRNFEIKDFTCDYYRPQTNLPLPVPAHLAVKWFPQPGWLCWGYLLAISPRCLQPLWRLSVSKMSLSRCHRRSTLAPLWRASTRYISNLDLWYLHSTIIIKSIRNSQSWFQLPQLPLNGKILDVGVFYQVNAPPNQANITNLPSVSLNESDVYSNTAG